MRFTWCQAFDYTGAIDENSSHGGQRTLFMLRLATTAAARLVDRGAVRLASRRGPEVFEVRLVQQRQSPVLCLTRIGHLAIACGGWESGHAPVGRAQRDTGHVAQGAARMRHGPPAAGEGRQLASGPRVLGLGASPLDASPFRVRSRDQGEVLAFCESGDETRGSG